MKGRFCYAAFFDKPGIEKLLNALDAKASFLVPVTSPLSARGPFSGTSVAGHNLREFISVSSIVPATVIFFVRLFLR